MSLTFSITPYPTGISPSSLAIGDLNGDGLLDLVTGNLGAFPIDPLTPLPPGTVSVFLGTGGGTFSDATPYPTGSVLPFSVAIGDLNGDSHLDLVTANFGDPLLSVDGTVSVFLGNGDGTLSAATQYTTGTPGAQSVAIGDLNGDPLPDLVVASASNRISVLLGNDVVGFQTQAPLSFTGLNNNSSIAIGDLDGDGRQDLAVANFGTDTGSGAGNSVTVLYGKDGGGFNRVELLTEGTNPSSVAIADLNGDGQLDLAVANAGSNTVSVFLNDGSGNLSLAATPYATGTNPTSVAIGDVNGDGLADLVTGNFGADPKDRKSVV